MLTINITIGERIAQAERLPKQGTVEYMNKIASIKKILVGFANAQMINWRIIPYNDTFLTALPDTATTITLDDDMIKTYASFIRTRSDAYAIMADEAEFCQKILNAEQEIISAEIAAEMKAAEEAMQNEISTSNSEEINNEEE